MELHKLITRIADVVDQGIMPGLGNPKIYISADRQALAFFAKHLVEPHRVLYMFYGTRGQAGDWFFFDTSYRMLIGEVRAGCDLKIFLQENYMSSTGHEGVLSIFYYDGRPILVYTHHFRVYPEMGRQIAQIEMAKLGIELID